MIHSFYKKVKEKTTIVSAIEQIQTSVGKYTGFIYYKSGEYYKVFYYNRSANVVIEDKYGYILEVSLKEL